MSYIEYFGFECEPFPLIGDSCFMDISRRGSMKKALVSESKRSVPILVVEGDVGAGKTTLMHQVEQELGNEEGIVVVDIGVLPSNWDDVQDYKSMISLIAGNEQILSIKDNLGDSERMVVLVDEAHEMSDSHVKAMQDILQLLPGRATFILFGFPNFSEKLPRTLKSRIGGVFKMGPFNEEDTYVYLNKKAGACGYQGALFTESVSRRIHEVSEGFARNINIVASKTLMRCAAKGRKLPKVEDVPSKRPVTIDENIDDSIHGDQDKEQSVARKTKVARIILIGALILSIIGVFVYFSIIPE